MAGIGHIFLVTRVVSYALDKFFDAKGSDIRAKVESAEAKLGPELARDLRKIARTAEVAKHTAKLEASQEVEFDEAVDRAWVGMRARKPEVAELELDTDSEPRATEDSGSSAWNWIAIVLLCFAIFMSIR